MLLFATILFLIFLMILLWNVKSDFFFIIFGIAAFLYLIIMFLIKDPFEIIELTILFMISNPLGLIILILPICIYTLYYYTKKISNKPKI